MESVCLSVRTSVDDSVNSESLFKQIEMLTSLLAEQERTIADLESRNTQLAEALKNTELELTDERNRVSALSAFNAELIRGRRLGESVTRVAGEIVSPAVVVAGDISPLKKARAVSVHSSSTLSDDAGVGSSEEDLENSKNGDMEDSLNVIWKHLKLEKSARDRSLLLYGYGNSVTVEAMQEWLKRRELTPWVMSLALWIFESPEDLDEFEVSKRVTINKQKVRVARLDGSD